MSSVVLDSLYSAALETIIMSFAKGHTWAPHSSGLCCEDKDSYLGYLGITQETVNEVYTLGFLGPALMRIWAGYFSVEGTMGMCKCLQTWQTSGAEKHWLRKNSWIPGPWNCLWPNGFRAAVSSDLFISESPGRDFVVFFVWKILCPFISQPITAVSSKKIIYQPI